MKLPSDQFIWVHLKIESVARNICRTKAGSTRLGGWEGDKFHLLSEGSEVVKSQVNINHANRMFFFYRLYIIISLVESGGLTTRKDSDPENHDDGK